MNAMREFVENKVCVLRTARGVTQEELGDAVGVSRQTIIAVEKGNYTPSVSLAIKLAVFFGVPVEKLFKICYSKES